MKKEKEQREKDHAEKPQEEAKLAMVNSPNRIEFPPYC
jgi:hypothetical protein